MSHRKIIWWGWCIIAILMVCGCGGNSGTAPKTNVTTSSFQTRDITWMHNAYNHGQRIRVAILGDSTACGYGPTTRGESVYGECANKMVPCGMEQFTLNLWLFSPYYLPFDETILPSIAPGAAARLRGIPYRRIEFQTAQQQTLTYTYPHRGVKRNTMTIIYLKRASVYAPTFDIVSNGITTTVDTHKAETTFAVPGHTAVTVAQQGYDVATQEIAISTDGPTFTFTLGNMHDRVGGEGTACILGFYYGNAIDFRNFAVSSMTLSNASPANIDTRGVTTTSQFQKAYDFGANVYVLSFGTNDSKTDVSTIDAFTTDLTARVVEIRQHVPDAVILLATAQYGEGIYSNNVQYNAAIRAMATAQQCSLLDVETILRQYPRAETVSTLDTGPNYIHPSAFAYRVIYQHIMTAFGCYKA